MRAWLLALIFSASLLSQPPKVRLPDESTGIYGIARSLISAFDQADIIAIGENHGGRLDADLRIAVVRHPDFAKKMRHIVGEFGTASEQSTLNRYIQGEDVAAAQFERAWKTTQLSSPLYADFFAAVREVNSSLPADERVRVFAGLPDGAAVSVLKEQVLQRHGKALVIYGAAHFYRTMGDGRDFDSVIGVDGIARTLEIDYPGRIFVVLPIGGPWKGVPGIAKGPDPEYQKIDRALKTLVRPVLVSLQRSPFRDLTAEEFIGQKLLTCRGARGCVSVFQGSTLTLGQMADACVYFGGEK